MIDLRSNYPVLPTQHSAFHAALASLPISDEYLRTAPPGHYLADRQVAADWLARPGFAVGPDQIHLSGGGHQSLLAIVLAARLAGTTVLVDPLAYNNFLLLAAQFNLKIVACPIDGEGMDPAALLALARRTKARAVYLTPTIHNPLSFVMPLARRQALVEVARECDLLLLDDDAYGFLEPAAPPSFAHLAPERSFYIYSFSKPVAPGVKLAYILAPDLFRNELTAALDLTRTGAAVLFARLGSEWIRSGALPELIAQKQAAATRRQQVLHRVLGPVVPYHTRPTSFHAWLPLAPSCDVQALEETLLTHGVKVVTSLSYQTDVRLAQPGLRVALSNAPDEATLEQDLAIVARLLAPSL